MRSVLCILASVLPLARCCSYVEVPVPDRHAVNGTMHVIGRTMEYGNVLGHFGHRIQVHNRQEKGGRYGFVSVDTHMNLFPLQGIWVPLEGMNEESLTVSGHILRESQYEEPARVGQGRNVVTIDVIPELLRNCASVDEALIWLEEHRIVAPQSEFGVHWAIADGSGRSVVVEYIRGQRTVYEGVRVLTNDPPLDFHLRNLNTYVNLNPDFPHQNDFMAVDTEVGTVPRTVGHGWNLFGLPGDSSPPSRFVQLFYLRGYATKFAPPKTVDDGIVLASALINKVYIPLGTVAKENSPIDNYDYPIWSMVKIPAEKRMLIRGYRNLQWRQIDLKRLDFETRLTWPVEDGTLGIQDITAQGTFEEDKAV